MIKDFLTLAFIVLLFAALTPGLYFTYPRNGPKYVVALCHGVAFALILYFTHSIVRGLFRKVTEGFKGRGSVTSARRIQMLTATVTHWTGKVAEAEAAGDEAALANAKANLDRFTKDLDEANAAAAAAAAAAADPEAAAAQAAQVNAGRDAKRAAKNARLAALFPEKAAAQAARAAALASADPAVASADPAVASAVSAAQEAAAAASTAAAAATAAATAASNASSTAEY